jgi:hypothetical protein
MSTTLEELATIARTASDNPGYMLNIGDEKNPEKQYQNDRLLVDAVTARINERLVQDDLTLEQVIKFTHQVSAGGKETDDNEIIQGGEYRSHEVAVGTAVPPRHEDIEELMTMFLDKLDTLRGQATENNIDPLTVWAFLVKSSIHPFPDGNGRTGRGLMDYLRTYTQKKLGLPIEHISLPTGQEMSNEPAGEILEQLSYILELMPRTATEPTAIDVYLKHKAEGATDEYFAKVKNLIESHIANVTDILVFETDPKFSKLQEFLQFAYSKNKYKTVPLVATYAKEKLDTRLKDTQ